jgi:succinate dehydrogenase / fumarate reductase cytochrome b subunit
MLEIGLLGTVILHALNGIRLTLIDLGVGHGRQRQMFWLWSIGIGAVIFLAGAIPIFLASVLKVM